MTLGTIIAIVLGIAVLVFLIFGFSAGWNNLWDQVTTGTSGSNIQVKIADCENDCKAGEKSSWCNEKKDLRFIGDDGETIKIEGTCNQFFRVNELSGEYLKYKTEVGNLKFVDCSAFDQCK